MTAPSPELLSRLPLRLTKMADSLGLLSQSLLLLARGTDSHAPGLLQYHTHQSDRTFDFPQKSKTHRVPLHSGETSALSSWPPAPKFSCAQHRWFC